jgi:hypothetical protein
MFSLVITAQRARWRSMGFYWPKANEYATLREICRGVLLSTRSARQHAGCPAFLYSLRRPGAGVVR